MVLMGLLSTVFIIILLLTQQRALDKIIETKAQSATLLAESALEQQQIGIKKESRDSLTINR